MSPKSLLVDDEVTKGDVPEGGVLRGDSACWVGQQTHANAE